MSRSGSFLEWLLMQGKRNDIVGECAREEIYSRKRHRAGEDYVILPKADSLRKIAQSVRTHGIGWFREWQYMEMVSEAWEEWCELNFVRLSAELKAELRDHLENRPAEIPKSLHRRLPKATQLIHFLRTRP